MLVRLLLVAQIVGIYGEVLFTMDPQPIALEGPDPTETFHAICAISGPNIQTVSSITIGTAEDGKFNPIATVAGPDSSALLLDISLTDRATVSGAISSDYKLANLAVHISDPQCTDGKRYYCQGIYHDENPKVETTYWNAETTMYPKSLRLLQHPLKACYLPGEKIYLNCTVDVGDHFIFENASSLFTWEWRIGRDWIDFPHKEDIFYNDVGINEAEKCTRNNEWSALLYYMPIKLHNGVQFRCKFGHLIAEGNKIQLDVKQPDTTPAATSSASSINGTNPILALAVGIPVSVVILVAVIVVIACVVKQGKCVTNKSTSQLAVASSKEEAQNNVNFFKDPNTCKVDVQKPKEQNTNEPPPSYETATATN